MLVQTDIWWNVVRKLVQTNTWWNVVKRLVQTDIWWNVVKRLVQTDTWWNVVKRLVQTDTWWNVVRRLVQTDTWWNVYLPVWTSSSNSSTVIFATLFWACGLFMFISTIRSRISHASSFVYRMSSGVSAFLLLGLRLMSCFTWNRKNFRSNHLKFNTENILFFFKILSVLKLRWLLWNFTR